MTDPILALALEHIAGSIQTLAQALASSQRPATKQDLDAMEGRLSGKLQTMAGTLDDVLQEVQDESALDDSIIALLEGIAQQLKDAQANPAKIQAVIDGIEANKAKITAAILANTPADPNAKKK